MVAKGVRELMMERVTEGKALVVVKPEDEPVMQKARRRSAYKEEREVEEPKSV